jgi:peptide/nickel transport system permease protein
MFFAFIGRFKFAILAQVTLSFLGLIDPSEKSLGMMIRYGMEYYYLDVWWYWILPPVVLLAMVLVALTFLIFSLEGVIDPRIKGVWRG